MTMVPIEAHKSMVQPTPEIEAFLTPRNSYELYQSLGGDLDMRSWLDTQNFLLHMSPASPIEKNGMTAQASTRHLTCTPEQEKLYHHVRNQGPSQDLNDPYIRYRRLGGQLNEQLFMELTATYPGNGREEYWGFSEDALAFMSTLDRSKIPVHVESRHLFYHLDQLEAEVAVGEEIYFNVSELSHAEKLIEAMLISSLTTGDENLAHARIPIQDQFHVHRGRPVFALTDREIAIETYILTGDTNSAERMRQPCVITNDQEEMYYMVGSQKIPVVQY